MANYNKVILMGRLTRDPALSYLPSQTAVCEIGLAVNHQYKDREGQQREDVCFIDCRCFGKQAEVLDQYMAKGRQILIEGRLQLDQWEDTGGQKRSRHRVFIASFQFLGKPDGDTTEQSPSPAPNNYPPPQPGEPTGEDIPF